MRVFCPNCGSENQGLAGGRVTCQACTATFEVPKEPAGATPAPRPVAPAQPSPLRGFDAGQHPQQPVFRAPPARGATGVPTNPLAIVSLVSGILCCIPFVAPITAIVTGAIAINQIDQGAGSTKGKGLAVAGIILGGTSMLFTILGVIGNLFK